MVMAIDYKSSEGFYINVSKTTVLVIQGLIAPLKNKTSEIVPIIDNKTSA